jgi:hypothetical protein
MKRILMSGKPFSEYGLGNFEGFLTPSYEATGQAPDKYAALFSYYE